MDELGGALLRAALAAVMCRPVVSHAQEHQGRASDYPNRPLRIIVTVPVGGSIDGVTRAMAERLSEKTGSPVIVDNRAGGTGTVAMNLAAQSAPDGYTLLSASNSIAVTGGKRMRVFPDVPTLAESGVPGVVLENVYGLYAPAGVSPVILAALNRNVGAVMNLPVIRDKLAVDGAEPASPHTPAEFKASFVAQFEQWDKFIKTSGIALE